MQHAPDADEHLIQVPGVPWAGSSPTEASGELGAEFVAPVPDALVSDHHAALGQDQLDVAQTEAEDVIQPHGVADDFSGKAVATVRGGFRCHPMSLARLPSERQSRVTCQCRGSRYRLTTIWARLARF